MKHILRTAALLAGFAWFATAVLASEDADKLTRMLQSSTLALLKEGNARFVVGKPIHPNQEIERRGELATAGQEPLATVLACSDSRDPVELIFDRGVGDLFVIRVAGNVAGVSELASIEYGVTHLGTPLLVVMGHSKCGAVTAVVKGAELHGHLPALATLISPAVEKAKAEFGPSEAAVPAAIQHNVWQQIENLLNRSLLIREAAAANKVLVVGAVYDIASGKIAWLGQHPEMPQLVAIPAPEEVVPAPAPAATASKPEPSPAKPASAKAAAAAPAPSLAHVPAGGHH